MSTRRARSARDKVTTNFLRPLGRKYSNRLTRRKIRQYKRNLWIASTAMQKWRINQTSNGSN